MLNLNDDDSRAVDAVFSQRATGISKLDQNPPDLPPANTNDPHPPNPARIHQVKRLLSLLDALPAEDPPASLLARTMRAVTQQVKQPTDTPWPFAVSPDAIDDLRSHAQF